MALTGGFYFNAGGDVVPVTGIYVKTPPDPCKLIADESTPAPGGFSSFTGFGHVAIDPSHVAFEGFSADSHGNPVKGIYTDFGGSLAKVIATGDSIGGSIVTDVNMGPAGFSGGQIAFQAAYGDGSQGISTAALGGGNRCPLSQGYWKNHPAQWPETTLTLGNQNYSQAELVSIINTSTSDASMQLARQLIPPIGLRTELNIHHSVEVRRLLNRPCEKGADAIGSAT